MTLHAARRLRTAGVPVAVVLIGLLVQGCSGGDTPAPRAASATSAPGDLLEQALKANADGDTAAAKRNFEALLAAEPMNKLASYNLGVLAQQAGDEKAAAEGYTRTLEVDPNYEPALYNLAILTNKQGDAQGAAALYERALKADPTDANAHYNLGLLLRRLGDPARGAAEIGEAIRLDPSLKQPAPLASATG